MRREESEISENHVIEDYILNDMHFEMAQQGVFSTLLRKIHPQGGSSFISSYAEGCNLLNKLIQTINESKIIDSWNLIHIFIVDSPDTASKITLADSLKAVGILNQNKKGKIRTFLFGISLPQQADKIMKKLQEESGVTATYQKIKENNLQDCFQKIIEDFKLETRKLEEARMSIDSDNYRTSNYKKRQRYAVVFNVPINSSMEGSRWASICEGFEKFQNVLLKEDIINSIVFNQQVRLIKTIPSSDQIYKKPLRESDLTQSFPPDVPSKMEKTQSINIKQNKYQQKEPKCHLCQLI